MNTNFEDVLILHFHGACNCGDNFSTKPMICAVYILVTRGSKAVCVAELFCRKEFKGEQKTSYTELTYCAKR